MIERFLFIIFDRIGNLNLKQVALIFFLHLVTGNDLFGYFSWISTIFSRLNLCWTIDFDLILFELEMTRQ